MPSISKEKLDELEASVEDAHSTCEAWRQRANASEVKARSIDGICPCPNHEVSGLHIAGRL